jgi:hypothetical protein
MSDFPMCFGVFKAVTAQAETNKKSLFSLKFQRKQAYSVAGWTRLELATSGLTGRRSNQLNYQPAIELNVDSINGRCRDRTYDHLLVRQVLYTS